MAETYILLVEDDPDTRALTLRALKKNSAASGVVVVRDGVEALDYLFGTGPYTGRDLESMPQLILLDLKLPKMAGFEVLGRIRADERTRMVPVVILSSSDDASDIRRAYEAGANSYVYKSTSFDDLLEVTSAIMRYWLAMNQPPPARERGRRPSAT